LQFTTELIIDFLLHN